MNESDWELLIDRIRNGKCTPFLGAGVNEGALPLGSELATKWAAKYGYPLVDNTDLAKVAQFLAVSRRDGLYPKDLIIDEIHRTVAVLRTDHTSSPPCMTALADLPFQIFLTTNYDDLLLQALRRAGKEPFEELCRWNTAVKKSVVSAFDSRRPIPVSDQRPIVYHLHGNVRSRQSIVITEDDYLDFLISVSRDPKLIPPRIQQSLTDSSLLFIGYGLRDINFRVIYRGLIQQLEGSLRTLSVSVQLQPGDRSSQSYLEQYFGGMNVQIYWGSAEQFSSELLIRWRSTHGTGYVNS